MSVSRVSINLNVLYKEGEGTSSGEGLATYSRQELIEDREAGELLVEWIKVCAQSTTLLDTYILNVNVMFSIIVGSPALFAFFHPNP